MVIEMFVTPVELTIPFNSPESLANANTQKENKENNQLVLGDLESCGFMASLITIKLEQLAVGYKSLPGPY